MFIKDQKAIAIRLSLVIIIVIGVYGARPVSASAGAGESSSYQYLSVSDDTFVPDHVVLDSSNRESSGAINNDQANSLHTLDEGECSSFMWTNGPSEPDIALQVAEELSQAGIEAGVEEMSYGETNGCGVYHQHGIDFKITLIEDAESKRRLSQQMLTDKIQPIVEEYGQPNLGNVKLFSAQGEESSIELGDEYSLVQPLEVVPLTENAVTKKVYVIVYDPILANGKKLSEHMHWNDHAMLTQQTIGFFQQLSNNKLNYTVVDTTIVTSGWPELVDGFVYTEQTYMPALSNPQMRHTPMEVNYNKIVNSSEFDICGRLNRGEIDEVWMYGGPWFGYYESTLIGPGAYWFNSYPVSGSHNCNKLLPIMGPSFEKTVNEAVHNFTHRTESTMKKVYGSWNQNNTSHNWNKFALVKAQSPGYSYSGCGNSHYPPNGTRDYDYTNSSVVLSNCEDFKNYPNLSDPLQIAQSISCTAWNCL